jgi:hypothetical protein
LRDGKTGIEGGVERRRRELKFGVGTEIIIKMARIEIYTRKAISGKNRNK